jgi:spore coat protein U-like protein
MGLTLTPSAASVTATGAPQTFYVGGVLSVGASQVAGTYTGTYAVSAEYQ